MSSLTFKNICSGLGLHYFQPCTIKNNYLVHLNEMFSKQFNHICIFSFSLLLNRGSNQNRKNSAREEDLQSLHILLYLKDSDEPAN